MKSFSVLISIFTEIFLFSNFCFSQSSANLSISGSVPPASAVNLVSLSESQSLNIGDDGAEMLVAKIQEKSNSPSGYRVLISSENGSRLKNMTAPNSFVPYTLSYGDAPSVMLTTSNQELKRVYSVGEEVTATSEVRVTLDKGPRGLGTYTDTVLISISAN